MIRFDTIGDFINTVLAAKDKDAAQAVLAAYNGWLCDNYPEHSLEQRAALIQGNIGWCFGEGMSQELKEMWHKLCGASHPYFGLTQPTAEQAFQAGLKLGREHKEKERKL